MPDCRRSRAWATGGCGCDIRTVVDDRVSPVVRLRIRRSEHLRSRCSSAQRRPTESMATGPDAGTVPARLLPSVGKLTNTSDDAQDDRERSQRDADPHGAGQLVSARPCHVDPPRHATPATSASTRDTVWARIRRRRGDRSALTERRPAPSSRPSTKNCASSSRISSTRTSSPPLCQLPAPTSRTPAWDDPAVSG